MPTEQTKLSEEQLAQLIGSGKYDYFPELINRMMPHIKAEAQRCKSIVPDTDDLVEEGVIAVFEAVKSFEKEKASFKTFAKVCIDRAIAVKVRAAKAGKRIPSGLISSMEESDISVESAEESYLRREEDDSFNKGVEKSLTSLEGNVLSLFLDGNSYSDISVKMGISVKSVDSALQRVRSKLKK